ncbi:folylpolyglutamate synthase/dihydrofolate synthase family protein [Bacillus sp. FJAT-50079]|uniref:bifunctional folylpolyglutamate synthase/dihydrofolate synthase n=1 Tax=Bacillus sp. FJAT-50079 TaxID=2833577 RepID=UPI001BCA5D3F|nr:folylpolyglutamate synthase/dihydrofolate synthase family protein [Bacillus sp. FJAT-50079]MBS4208941.1 bifunctional folylpolyglutamate synthase/dihydrofolate synthase [Bacillus sp. FJAT-50079]
MLHTYKEALEWVHSRLRLGIKPGLSRMEWMLEKLGHPEKRIKSIHVGGTNGKGSTVTYLRSILVEAGYEVGSFTSPYIEQFNERISINGVPISDEEIVQLVNAIKPLADELEKTDYGAPTEFEVITAMAIYYFGEVRPLDFAIFEVGLGGRFDSTNVIQPLLSIITNIGMDHVQILGNSIEDIAYEKAGIIKEHTPIFTSVRDEAAFHVIQAEAAKKHALLFQLGINFTILNYEPIQAGEQFTFSTTKYTFEGLQVSLLGKHQTENAAGAIAALLYLTDQGVMNISESALRAGLRKAYWPGRMELLHNDPIILLDGAHNREGVRAFVDAIQSRYADRNIKLVFSALGDKDLTEMFTIMNELDGQLYVTEFDFPRAASANELKRRSENPTVIANNDWFSLLKELVSTLEPNDLLAITGSLYFISSIKPDLQKIIVSEFSK